MSLAPLVLGFLNSSLVAVGAWVLWRWKRRQEEAIAAFSEQLAALRPPDLPAVRIGTADQSAPLAQLGRAINDLLDDLERHGTRLKDNEGLFRRLIETVRDAMLLHGENIVFANTHFLDMLGMRADEVVGKPLAQFAAPEYVKLVAHNLERRLAGESAAARYEIELVGKHGKVTRVEISSTVVETAGEPALLLTALEMLPSGPQEPAPSSPRARVTLDAMAESVITVDTQGRIDYINHAAAMLLGRTSEQVLGKTFPQVASLVDESDRRSLGDPVSKALAAGGRVTMGKRAVLVPVHGSAERSVEISVTPLKSNGNDLILGLVLVMHDTSEMRGLARQMTYQASHDALTGLVNRREFERRLREATDAAQAGDMAHALCYLDLDRFKVVNDTCGHKAGDDMLREVAAIIKDAVRDSDTAGRIGGDEFALLLAGCPLEKARQIADDVVRAVNDYRFVWKDKIFNIGVSVGLVEIGRGGNSIEDLMNAADSACYVAKKQGGVHVHVY